ncbi:MAG: response regulator transcription factor [Nitrospirae bacterium]|nr:response regulator transcription factor [Nitrospirota bacterium]
MIKILIADDHAIVRKGLKQILADAPVAVLTDEAGSGQEALKKVRENDYNVVLLDISMPGMSGVDVLKQLKSEKPKLPVLILTMHPEEQYAVRILKAGASGYLTKESAPDELISAIQKVSQGGKYISPSLAEKLASDLDHDIRQPLHEMLSDREYQIMTMLASGKSTKEIAQELSLSMPTVSTYRSRILQKMNLKNNAELINYAIKNNLL